MHWFKENWFKLSIVSIVFLTGLSTSLYFLAYIPHQNETKRYDQLAEEARSRAAKEEQDKRDYIAKRKKDCFDIYDKEKTNWSNTAGVDYDERWDKCYVIYNNTGIKSKNCTAPSTSTDPLSSWGAYLYNLYFDCQENQFRKEF